MYIFSMDETIRPIDETIQQLRQFGAIASRVEIVAPLSPQKRGTVAASRFSRSPYCLSVSSKRLNALA